MTHLRPNSQLATDPPPPGERRPKLRFRLQGWFWDSGPLFLPPLRRLRLAASLLLYRWRSRSRPLPPRIVPVAPGRRRTPPLEKPLIAVHASGGDHAAVERFLAAQTETSVTTDPAAGERASFCLGLAGEGEPLPATWLESQLLAMVAEDLEYTVCGWATLRLSPLGLSPAAAEITGPAATPCPGLVRLPTADARRSPPVIGRAVPHVTAELPPPARQDACPPPARRDEDGRRNIEAIPYAGRSGPYFLRSDVAAGQVVHHRLHSLHDALGRLPVEPGPPTVLFLLPFLAVGGAESLLFDLLAGLRDRYRLLVVTVEPHRAELGQTVDEARALTPHVYTLGDWLPRPAHPGALRHLIRRWAVEVLMSWNGTVFFYDVAPGLRRSHPRLRILNQLFNHRGGWIEHYGPRLVASVDLHVAVNRVIGRALSEERGVPEERLAMIHHGVRLPGDVPDELRAERRRRARRELGLPRDAIIVGSFMRMHPQKRPFDVISLAERALEQASPPPGALHFLLVGGGPLDAELDRALEQRKLPNLTRLPLRRDLDRLYDAVDLCLLTSAYEGLPVFLLDALARRIPCVATAVGDVPCLLRDGGGILVEQVGDPEALAAALSELCDAERRAAEGELGRATVARRFGVERYARAYEAAFFPPSAAR